MKYIAKKNGDYLDIITWCLDEHYQEIEDRDAEYSGPDPIFYMIFVDRYDSQGNQVFQDGIGGIDIQSTPNSSEFVGEIVDSYEFHFLDAEFIVDKESTEQNLQALIDERREYE